MVRPGLGVQWHILNLASKDIECFSASVLRRKSKTLHGHFPSKATPGQVR